MTYNFLNLHYAQIMKFYSHEIAITCFSQVSKILRPYKFYDMFKITSFKNFQFFLEFHVSQTMPNKLKRGSTRVANIKLFSYLLQKLESQGTIVI